MKTAMSTVFCVSGFVLCGVWQRMQNASVLRPPPWALIGLWQLLQLDSLTTSLTVVTEDPFGTNVNTLSDAAMVAIPYADRSRSACMPILWVAVASKFAGALTPNV